MNTAEKPSCRIADHIATARSFLFVPADRPERFDKAFRAGADMVIIDLEDAVIAKHKATGRDNIKTYLSPDHTAIIRINAKGSPDFLRDLEICGVPGIAGVILSKAVDCQDLVEIRQAAPGIHILPLIETAQGLANALELARMPGVSRLMFGSIDFQLDLGIPGDGEGLAAFRSQLVLISRLARIAAPVDGVSISITDDLALQRDIARAKAFGFTGKLCIHPAQIEAVNQGFSPSSAEQEWARQILNAVAKSNPDSGAISYAGQMIDLPVQLQAERILQRCKPMI